MARAWRIEYEGALYHVLSRGNEKQDIVINDDDRTLFLRKPDRLFQACRIFMSRCRFLHNPFS